MFDKGMSSRALCLAAGGNFYNLAQEGKGELSFQPLARIDDDTEEAWCQEWILSFCEQMKMDVKPQHRTLVWDALESLKTMPVEERTISNFYNFVQSQDIKDALVMLTKTGSYGRLFDNGKMISVAQYPSSGNITFLPARFTVLYGVGKNHKKSTKLYYYNLVDFSFVFYISILLPKIASISRGVTIKGFNGKCFILPVTR